MADMIAVFLSLPGALVPGTFFSFLRTPSPCHGLYVDIPGTSGSTHPQKGGFLLQGGGLSSVADDDIQRPSCLRAQPNLGPGAASDNF